MKSYGVFDILGPIMVGPSSSHTAGAARIGKVALQIAGSDFNKVDFMLHGSFAKTYKGHGTDRALTAGILGMDADDEGIRNSIEIARRRGVVVNFIESDLGDEHPNTVKIIFYKNENIICEVIGSSIGGGNITITEIDGDKVEINGRYPTLFIKHKDKEGMISSVSSILAQKNINIASMKVSRKEKGKEASMIIETDSFVDDATVKVLMLISGIISVRFINPV